MNYHLDDIRRIQTQLAEIPCRVCGRQGLALLLRYDGHQGRCLFMAFCKACQMKDLVEPDTVHCLDGQGPHDLQTLTANLARP